MCLRICSDVNIFDIRETSRKVQNNEFHISSLASLLAHRDLRSENDVSSLAIILQFQNQVRL
jgi:hypothetical protein